MRKIIFLTFFLSVLRISHSGVYAQGITITTSSTPSICYNDGTLTVTASGGTVPFTYTILSGPSNPNLTYPIVLPTGSNTFINLPHGTFPIQVVDASGHIDTFSGSVGGTYQFPQFTFYQPAWGTGTNYYDTLVCRLVAGTGKGPFQFAISSTSSSAGFGPYQSSGTFSNLCPGTYWVRMMDSCQNIYTAQYVFYYKIDLSVLCVNYSHGILSVSAQYGNGPYTYIFSTSSGHADTSTTGNFTGLSSFSANQYLSGTLTVYDSCGVSASDFVSQEDIDLTEPCPFDSTIIFSNPIVGGPADTTYLVCPDCSPLEIDTILPGRPFPSVPFHTTNPTQIYHAYMLTTHVCGFSDTLHMPLQLPTSHNVGLVSFWYDCNTFAVYQTNSTYTTKLVFDSFSVFSYPSGTLIATVRGPDTIGLFHHLPEGTYTVVGYRIDPCYTYSSIINVPYLTVILEMMADDSCHFSWELLTPNNGTIWHEDYSLVTPTQDTLPFRYQNSTLSTLYDITTPGTYYVISDSGCSQNEDIPVLPVYQGRLTSYVTCTGPIILQYEDTVLNDLNLNQITRLRIYNPADSIIKDTTFYNYFHFNKSIVVQDTGLYHFALYYRHEINPDSSIVWNDSICPVDTGSVYVTNSQVPYPSPATVYTLCDTIAGPVQYHIYGGEIPYTVEVPGYSTTTLNTNTGIFPATSAGAYTMIVYDNCGISRSYTFTILDTCPCPVASISIADSVLCFRDTVHLISTSTGAAFYQWLVNGQIYSHSADTILLVTAGGDSVLLKVYSFAGCMDSSFIHIFDTCYTCPVASISLPDTISCLGDTVHLISASTGAVSYQWLVNGQLYSRSADTILITTAGGDNILLRVYATEGCKDSSSVHIRDTCSICPVAAISLPDTISCLGDTVHLMSASTGAVSYQWLVNGQLYSRSADTILITTAGGDNILLRALAIEGCKDSASVHIRDTCSICPVAAISLPDTISCLGDTVHLMSASTGAVSYQWLVNGQLYSRSADTTLITTAGGDNILLRAFAIEGCMDSASIHIRDTCSGCPTVFITTNDTFYCAGDTVYLSSSDSGSVYRQWLINGLPYSNAADTLFLIAQGDYTCMLRAFSVSGCEDSAFINFSAVGPLSIYLGPDTIYCDTFNRILSTGIPSTHWSTGQTGAQIIVNAPGHYSATVSNQCGTYSDTINIYSFMINGFELTANQNSICDNKPDSALLLATVDSLSQPAVTFIWSSGQVNSMVFSSSYIVDSIGTYQVTVLDSVCKLYGSETITAMQCDSNCNYKIAIPDIFTPNGDTKNDTFVVLHTCPVFNFSIHIYDRWGQLVFESANIDAGWDGLCRGQQQPEGTYVWFVCIAETSTSTINCMTGTLQLVR